MDAYKIAFVIIIITFLISTIPTQPYKPTPNTPSILTPFSKHHKIYVINMRKRKDKWNNIKTRFPNENLTWAEGFDVQKNTTILHNHIQQKFIKQPTQKIKYGYLGGAIAHINVWKTIANGKDDIALVLEDDSVPSKIYLRGLYEVIKNAPDFHFIHMCVLRPNGIHIKNGLLKVKTKQILDTNKLPNVWMSAYLITKNGAHKLIQLFQKYNFDLNTIEWDRALVFATNKDTTFNRYVVKDQRYFIHDEHDSDRRGNIIQKIINLL